MARNGSGNYSLPANYEAVPNETIESAKFNATVEDLANAHNDSLLLSGVKPMTGNLPMGGNKVTGLADGTASTDAATKGQVDTGLATKQPLDAGLTSIAGLTTSANQMIYTTGTDLYATTALTAFARTILDDADASTVLSTLGVSAFAKTILDDADAATARTTLGLGGLATASSINNANWSGTDLAVANGGTGASDAATARTNLGLGNMATQNTGSFLAAANNLSELANAATARTNLGLGSMATEDTDLYRLNYMQSLPSVSTIIPGFYFTNGNDLGITGIGDGVLEVTSSLDDSGISTSDEGAVQVFTAFGSTPRRWMRTKPATPVSVYGAWREIFTTSGGQIVGPVEVYHGAFGDPPSSGSSQASTNSRYGSGSVELAFGIRGSGSMWWQSRDRSDFSVNFPLELNPNGGAVTINGQTAWHAGNDIILKSYTVATLPTGTRGKKAIVTDATATTYRSTVAGGGANTVEVTYDGTNWLIVG